MLKGIPEILSPELLKVLCEIGWMESCLMAKGAAYETSYCRRGCGESAGAADDHAAKEYGAT